MRRRLLHIYSILPIFLGAVFLALHPACNPSPKNMFEAGKRPNIIIIVIETLRADHLRAYGYPRLTMPNLEEVARDGIFFERASTAAPWTLPSVVSILSGLPPSAHGVTTYEAQLPQEVATLAERLRPAGYHTAFLGVNSLFEADRKLEQGFDYYYGTDEIAAEELNRHLLAWLHDHSHDTPLFLYTHYFDPHCPYRPPEDYTDMYWPPPRELVTHRTMTLQQYKNMHECYHLHHQPDEPILDVDYYLAQYDAELRHTDALVGIFLERLKTAGIYNSSLIFILGDHGEEFYEHDGFGHGRVLYEHSIHIPFFVRLPGGKEAGRRISERVSTLDIYPTALSAAGLEPRIPSFGQDLLPAFAGDIGALKSHAIFSETDYEGTQRAVLQGPWKLIVSPDKSRPEGLFDLDDDPNEKTDMSKRQPARRRTLLKALVAQQEAALAIRKTLPNKNETPTDALLEKLRSMGYVRP